MSDKNKVTDIFGKEIVENAKVVAARHNVLCVCNVVKLHPKMVRVSTITSNYKSSFLVYPRDVAIVDGPDVMAYVLKGSK